MQISVTYHRTIPTVKYGKEEVTVTLIDEATSEQRTQALDNLIDEAKAAVDRAELQIFATSSRPIDMPPLLREVQP